MSRAASIIEINGTTYDAATGNVVGAVKKVASQVKDQTKVIDGFVRKSGSYAKAKTETIRPARPAAVRHVKNAGLVHNRAQKSKALMRTVVRPKMQETSSSRIKPSVSKAVGLEQERRSRANAIVRDHHVKRFGVPSPGQPRNHQARMAIVAKARPMVNRAQSSTAVAAPLPSMIASASHQRLERMLDEALVRADAHKQSLKAHSKNPLNRFNLLPRWLTIGIILVILVVVAAFVAMRNIPQVAIKVAGEQAHVSAALPSYTPSGFAVAGPISHSAGIVSVKYTSSSGYSYDLAQRSSTWDSSSLAANVLASNADVQTSVVQGMTVYIYGQHNNATWVNNGVWYSLSNHASLTSDQILRIVQSL